MKYSERIVIIPSYFNLVIFFFNQKHICKFLLCLLCTNQNQNFPLKPHNNEKNTKFTKHQQQHYALKLIQTKCKTLVHIELNCLYSNLFFYLGIKLRFKLLSELLTQPSKQTNFKPNIN